TPAPPRLLRRLQLAEGSEGIAAARALAPPPAGSLRHAVQPLPLGIPVRFECDAPELIAAAQAVYGDPWAGPAPAPASGLRGPTVPRVVLLLGTQRAAAPVSDTDAALRITANRDLLLLAAPDALGRAQRTGMTAVARLAPSLLTAHERPRAVLDALVLVLLTPLDRQPLHAAAVAPGGSRCPLARPARGGGPGRGQRVAADRPGRRRPGHARLPRPARRPRRSDRRHRVRAARPRPSRVDARPPPPPGARGGSVVPGARRPAHDPPGQRQ